ncbi:cytochrome b-c1 complex subunit 9 [Macrophomina phaseolina]|uniref:Complex III subunit 9 n=1 Tax=Macrophomina phaseolina TaxID=35725 RepID=A0ABQ8GU71_9PEZI|nr:cytochrome b-c1 complex subunit 9 [Macrophomina phaseolina]
MAGLASSFYNTLIKRNTVFLATVFVSAFGAQLAFDTTSDKIWDSINKGRQWKDIKHRYLNNEEE